jgi:hypothetical protein
MDHMKTRNRRQQGLSLSMLAGLGLSLSLILPTPGLAVAVGLSRTNLRGPYVLDQNAHLLRLAAARATTSGALPNGSVPTYVAYQVKPGTPLPSQVPTVSGTSLTAPGSRQLNSVLKTQLDQALAKYGQAAVRLRSPRETLLVQSIFPASSGSSGSSQAWVASTTSPPAATTHAASPTTTTNAGTGTNAAQSLSPASIVSSITGSSLYKEITSALHIGSSSSTNAHPAKSTAATASRITGASDLRHASVAAEMLQAPATTDTGTGTIPTDTPPLPAPVPEPGSVLVFGLALGALAIQRRRGTPRRGS